MAIAGACIRAAQSARWPIETIDAWRKEALCLDREHFLDQVFEYFDVQKLVSVRYEVSRDSIE